VARANCVHEEWRGSRDCGFVMEDASRGMEMQQKKKSAAEESSSNTQARAITTTRYTPLPPPSLYEYFVCYIFYRIIIIINARFGHGTWVIVHREILEDIIE